MSKRTTRTERLDIRLTPDARQMLVAAAAERRSISDFVLNSALNRAEETLLDRRVFTLAPEQWEAFIARLDAPPQPNDHLRKLMTTPSLFSDNEPS